MLRSAPLLMLACLALGCSHYEYDVLQPSVPQNRAGTDQDLSIAIDPLRYDLRSVESRLVIRISNPTPDVIQLIGVRSAIIDPTGQARPIRSQPIPPGAFIKLVLPPVRPEYVARGGGPRLGFGAGLGRGEFGYTGYDAPVEYTLQDGGETYWDWRGETQARITLVFNRNGQEFTHDLAFSRVKVK